VPRVPFKAFRSRGADPKKALKERRPVFWEETKGFKKDPGICTGGIEVRQHCQGTGHYRGQGHYLCYPP